MKITKRISIFFILCCLCASFSASATHLHVSNWHYTCLGGNTYEVTLELYRSCSGLPLQPTITTGVTYSSASCGTTLLGSLTLVSSSEVTPICPFSYSQTSCNGGMISGIELGVYTDTVTLPSNCNDWVIEYSTCCRNGSGMNFSSISSNDLVGYAVIDNQNATCNSSPTFADNAVQYACSNQPFYYNPNGVDADGDSLVYSITNAMAGYGVPIAFAAGYSTANPVSTDPNHDFYINPATGEITFTADFLGTVIVTLLVEEYRNGVLIGSSTQEVEIQVSNCSNNAPTYDVTNLSSGAAWDSDANTVYACPSSGVTNNLSFDFVVTDVDAAQTVTISHNFSHPSATLSFSGTNPVIGTFTWNNLPSQTTVLDIDLVIEDNACPIASQQLVPLTIEITAGQITAYSSTTAICSGDMTELTAVWTPDVYTGSLVWSNGAIGDTITTNTAGIYSAVGSYCPTSVTSNAIALNLIAAPITSTSNDTTILVGGIAYLSVQANGSSTFTYNWTPGTDLSCTTCANPFVSPTQTTMYTVEVTDIVNGCVGIDSVLVVVDTPYYGVDTVEFLMGIGDTITTIIDVPAFVMHSSTSLINLCGGIDGTFTAIAGDSIFSYVAPSFAQDIDTLCVELCSSLGICDTTIYIITTVDCVWAGDTDTNQVVNNFDVLNVGLGFGETGAVRQNADLNFDCELVENWTNSTPVNFTNYKHADTDGNGVVNLDDTMAIHLNWGQMYMRNGQEDRQSGAPLFVQSTVTAPNTTLDLPIILGDMNNVVADAYGIAFTITYDDALIEPNSVEILYNNSWMGTSGTDLLGMHKDFYGTGSTEVAITRLDGMTQSGYGEIATVRLTIKDDIMKRSGGEERLDLAITNAYLITNQEVEIETAPEATQVLISTNTSSVQEIEESLNIQLYPNPTKGQFNLVLSEAIAVESIQIMDLTGRIVQQVTLDKNLPNSVYTVDGSHLADGVYFVQLKTNKTLYSEKLIIQQ